jgi:hypothetical protein
MVTAKYESAVSERRAAVIDLLLGAVMIELDRDQAEGSPWIFNPACNGPCESPA